MGQGKVFIRSLHKDLIMNAVASITLVRFNVFFVIHLFVSPCGHAKSHVIWQEVYYCQKQEKLGEKKKQGGGWPCAHT